MLVRRRTPRRFGVLEDVTRFRPDVDWHPGLDLYESADAFILFIEVPGVSLDDIEITVDGRTIAVVGTRSGSMPAGAIAHLIESAHGTFERRLQLPDIADLSRLTTHFENGVLLLTIPKSNPGEMTMTVEGWASP